MKSASVIKRRRWTPTEIERVRSEYPNTRTEDLANAIGRTAKQVYMAAHTLGLHKSPEYLASEAACRLGKGRDYGAHTRFKAGQKAWNHGLKGVVGVQEGCRATQFKKGRLPQEAANYQPIGTLRVCSDGILLQKITDDITVRAGARWVPVHRMVWERERGPVPAGHAVVFKPGMKTSALQEITADRLECISRAELMKRNSVHAKYPPELAKIAQLRGAINRQINRRAREAAKA